jgi:CRP-like cAMP-binding protein
MADDSPRKLKKLVKELERAVRDEPANLTAKIRLAGAYRDSGQKTDAVRLYRDVAAAYVAQGRRAQAVAVCRGILEIEPGQAETSALLATLGSEGALEPPPSIPSRGSMSGAVPIQVPPSDSVRGKTPPPPIAPGTLTGARPMSTQPTGWTRQEEEPSAGRSWPRQPSDTGSAPKLHGFEEEAAPNDPFAVPTGRESYGGPKEGAPPIPGIARPRGPQFDDEMTSPAYDHMTPPRQTGTRPGSQISLPPAALRVDTPARPRTTKPLKAAEGDDEETRVSGVSEDWSESSSAQEEATNPGSPKVSRPTARALTAVDLSDVGGRLAPGPPALPLAPPRVTQPRMTAVRPKSEAPTRAGSEVTAPSAPPVFHEDIANRPGEPTKTDSKAPIPPMLTMPGRAKLEPTAERPGSPETTMAASPSAIDGRPRRTLTDPRGLTAQPDPDTEELTKAFDGPFTRLGPADEVRGLRAVSPLFEDLPAEAHAELVRRMVVRRVGTGTLIVREGDPGDACYVIGTGSVRVLKRTPDGRRLVEVARLSEGSLFGEFALLADRRRHASVEALTDVELFEIPRRLLDELAIEHPGLGGTLSKFFRERLLGSLIATAPFFRALPRDERAGLAARFHTRHVEPGEVVIEEGRPGGGLYLVVLGAVEIRKKTQTGPVNLAKLGEGSYFGEMSLLRGGTASATVVAAEPTELAELAPRDFYEVVAAHPTLWEEIRREAARRELATHQILAGDSNVV